MKRLTLLLTAALVAGGCAATSAPSVAHPTPPGPTAAAVASNAAVSSTGQPGAGTSVTCTLPADVCGDAVRAVESVAALNAGMPPAEVAVLDFADCRTVTGAPKGYDPCAASIPMPAEPSATGGGDGLATVTYGDGLGKAFLYVWWRTFPSGRGPINAVVEAHNP